MVGRVLHIVDHRRASLCRSTTSTIGCTTDGPPCATVPHIGDIPWVDPSSIRSICSLHREERSNNAQRLPNIRHTLEVLRVLNLLHPWGFSFLSPGCPHRPPQHERELMHRRAVSEVYPGECTWSIYPGIVWPPWGREGYGRVVYPTMEQGVLYPPWCPGYIHPPWEAGTHPPWEAGTHTHHGRPVHPPTMAGRRIPTMVGRRIYPPWEQEQCIYHHGSRSSVYTTRVA